MTRLNIATGSLKKTSFPFYSKKELLEEAENVWESCETDDWLEAFGHHPKIGNMDALREKFSSTREWASMEQSGVQAASELVLEQLSLGNEQYEKKFGFIFIVCATGPYAESNKSKTLSISSYLQM